MAEINSIKQMLNNVCITLMIIIFMSSCGGGSKESDEVLSPKNWFEDGDRDGFGNSQMILSAVDQPLGYVSDATDCDDNNADIYPGAMELANQVDDDCDTIIDNGLNYVFTTSFLTRGNMAWSQFISGGLSGADGICQELADESNLTKAIYQAWLSSSTIAAKDRLSGSNNPYYLPDGTLLASNWSDFLSRVFEFTLSPGRGLDVDENGNMMIGMQYSWTNTSSDGSIVSTNSSEVCNDWKSATGTGVIGALDQSGEGWTNSTTGSCADSGTQTAGRRLYCIQQTSEFLEKLTDEPRGANCFHNDGVLIEKGLDNGDGNEISGNGILEAGEVDTSYYKCDVAGLGQYQLGDFALNLEQAVSQCENKKMILATWSNESELNDLLATCQLLSQNPNSPLTLCYTQYKVNDLNDGYDSVIDGSPIPDTFNNWDFFGSPPPNPLDGQNVMIRSDNGKLVDGLSFGPAICMP